MRKRVLTVWVLWKVRTWLLFSRPLAALHQVDVCMRSQPDEPRVLAMRAHVLALLGKSDEALRTLQQLLQVRPGHAADWFNYGFMCEASGQVDAAETAFRRALAINPSMDRAWYGLGLALIQLGRLDEAAQALKKNTELQPMSPYGWYQLARVELERGQPQETIRIIRHLHRFEPRVAAQLQRETGLCQAVA